MTEKYGERQPANQNIDNQQEKITTASFIKYNNVQQVINEFVGYSSYPTLTVTFWGSVKCQIKYNKKKIKLTERMHKSELFKTYRFAVYLVIY